MKKIVIIAIAVVVAAGGLFALSKTGSAPSAKSDKIVVKSLDIKESTDQYEINAKYPQFGVEIFDARIKRAIDEAVTEIKNSAPPAPSDSGYKNSLDTIFSDEYVGDDYLSVRLTISQYTGGAHPMSIVSGLNFDRMSGKVLELSDALSLTGLTVEQLSQKVTTELTGKLGDAMFTEGANTNPENFSSFAVSKDAVTFIFQPYQVAAYAAGVQEVALPRVKK